MTIAFQPLLKDSMDDWGWECNEGGIVPFVKDLLEVFPK
jgi:hypothetical protein